MDLQQSPKRMRLFGTQTRISDLNRDVLTVIFSFFELIEYASYSRISKLFKETLLLALVNVKRVTIHSVEARNYAAKHCRRITWVRTNVIVSTL